MRICLPAYTFVTRKGLGSMACGPTSCVSNMAMGFTAALTSGEASHPGERPVPRLSSRSQPHPIASPSICAPPGDRAESTGRVAGPPT